MKTTKILRLMPSMQIIAEELDALGWQYQADIDSGDARFCGVRMFHGQRGLNEDYVYVVRKEDAGTFPTDRCAYLCTTPLSGEADHICCPQQSPEELFERILELFQRYQEWERQLDGLVLSNADLNDLCNWGKAQFGNPVTIHDPWYIVLAMSDDVPQIVSFENIAESSRSYIPREVIDSFRDNPDYLRSLSEKRARLWTSSYQGKVWRCIYANLWDGGEYQARLLITEESQPFRTSHFLAAECMAQRAMLILNKGRAAGRWGYHSLDDIVYAFLTGRVPDVTDSAIMLSTLQWQTTDQYQCILLQSQKPDTAAAFRQIIHSDLFQLFPGSYVMFIQQQQCVVLNLNQTFCPLPQVCHRLDTLCQNYRLYAGISSPVRGIEELHYAFRQADIALGTACHLQNQRWAVPFFTCALDFMLRNIQTDLLPRHLAAPELLILLDYDQKKGTTYFSTLRTFIINERDIHVASQAMIVHRTTLAYRIKKIQSITGLDLDDPDQRLYLLLSFRLLEQADILMGQGHCENDKKNSPQ